MYHKFLLGFFLLLLSFMGFSQKKIITNQEELINPDNLLEEVVVVDSRFEMKRSQSGKNVIKISEKEIKNYQGRSLSELLQTYGGINIIGARSAAGQNLNLSIRGGRNRQVLILIDGVRVSDPSRIDNDFDLNFINLSDIVSIEIVKGAASTLYGSSASTGVINIRTRKSNKIISTNFGSYIGSQQAADTPLNRFSYLSSFATLNGTQNNFIYKFSVASLNIEGLSSVSNGDELDRFNRSNLGFQLGKKGKSIIWNFSYNKDYIISDYDNSFPVEDADFILKTDLERFSWNSSYSYEKGSLNASLGFQTTNRDFQDSFPRLSEASNISLDIFNKYIFKQKFYAIFGYSHQKSTYKGVPSVAQNDLYFNFVYLSTFGLNINTGSRFNVHEIYGNHQTYSINPSYSLKLSNEKSLKLFSSLSSAFIPPSLYQLHDSYSGNLELEPEENTTFEIGSELVDGDNKVSLVVFRRTENPKLIYDYLNYRYGNSTKKNEYNGIEFEYQKKLFDTVDFRFNYTYNETTGGNLINLPKQALGGVFDYGLSASSHMNASIQYIGNRISLSETELDSYALLDLKLTQTFKNHNLTAFFILSNVFDKNYIEIENYSTQGRNFRIGFNFGF